MKKIVRLTESDLKRIVRRVIKENEMYSIKNEKSTCIGSKVIYSTRLLLHAKQIDGLRTP